MHVVFLHGPAASGKHTIGSALSAISGWPLFHNHLAVDAAKALFAFGTPGFKRLRAEIWTAAFAEAAAAGQSFVFTFHPEASVDPALIGELEQVVKTQGGRVHFVELRCSREAVLARVGNQSRARFGKLTDAGFYAQLEAAGAFEFPPLPMPLLVIDTEQHEPAQAAALIAQAVATAVAKA